MGKGKEKHAVDNPRKLTSRQQRFVEEYLVDLNGTQAAIRAGYSKRTADRMSYENLRKPEVAKAIKELKAIHSKNTGVTSEQVIAELKKIAFADTVEFCEWDGDKTKIKPSKELSPEARAAISDVEMRVVFGPDGRETMVRVKRHDKIRALELLGKHVGAFDPAANRKGKHIKIEISDYGYDDPD